MAVPRGLLSLAGHISVRNIAMPKLTGTAIMRAIADVTRVPTIGTSPPNTLVTGFHVEVPMNPKPNFLYCGQRSDEQRNDYGRHEKKDQKGKKPGYVLKQPIPRGIRARGRDGDSVGHYHATSVKTSLPFAIYWKNP